MIRHLPRQTRAAALALACLALADAAGAQSLTPARLIGRVVDRPTGAGVPRAEVALPDDGRRVETDTAGRFVLLGLTPGVQRVRVRAIGWKETVVLVSLVPGQEVERLVALVPAPNAQGLQAVTVSARAPGSYRLADFHRRRETGRGHYLTEEDIRQRGASTVADAARGLRGVSEQCGGTASTENGGCRLQMSRARRNCQPDYIVDGRVDNVFGSTTPIRDVVALEVYTGPADLPAEFGGTAGSCGVVVIWTRSAPDRKPK